MMPSEIGAPSRRTQRVQGKGGNLGSEIVFGLGAGPCPLSPVYKPTSTTTTASGQPSCATSTPSLISLQPQNRLQQQFSPVPDLDQDRRHRLLIQNTTNQMLQASTMTQGQVEKGFAMADGATEQSSGQDFTRQEER